VRHSLRNQRARLHFVQQDDSSSTSATGICGQFRTGHRGGNHTITIKDHRSTALAAKRRRWLLPRFVVDYHGIHSSRATAGLKEVRK
jgi:hypothetical protein